jgi:superfamily I DNA and/or RNA helicase
VQLSEAPFDTVIIDEAARANPLDLLIPLSVASKRVVLVGDHRQLPQMLEDELEARLADESPDTAVEEVLRRSFFERLFTSLRSVDGGVERTVTLDQQFRMHPLLGDFLDRQFYRPHGEAISNGPGTEERGLQGLPFGSPAVWVDVPRSEGGEERGGSPPRSWQRISEARATASLIRSLVDADPTRTLGVITFYTAQEAAIWAELESTGHATRGSEGPALSTTWLTAFNDSGIPRVRIGTVDRFQGREFDVVLLSLVRSSPPPHASGRERAHRRFGFLAHPNRLCVAMSRQRDALVVVGDRSSYVDDHAQQLVPALAAFAQLAIDHEVPGA